MGRFDPDFLDHSNALHEQSAGLGHDPGQNLLFQQDMDLKQATEAFERRFIEQALQANRWSRMHTAKALGIHRKTLHAKMRKYGVG